MLAQQQRAIFLVWHVNKCRFFSFIFLLLFQAVQSLISQGQLLEFIVSTFVCIWCPSRGDLSLQWHPSHKITQSQNFPYSWAPSYHLSSSASLMCCLLHWTWSYHLSFVPLIFQWCLLLQGILLLSDIWFTSIKCKHINVNI